VTEGKEEELDRRLEAIPVVDDVAHYYGVVDQF